MSVPVLRERRLWGLIACHHRRSRAVPQSVRMACVVVSQLAAQVLAGIELRAETAHAARMRAVQMRLVRCVAKREPFSIALIECGGELLTLLAADGVAVCAQGECRLIGHTPTAQETRVLADWVGARALPLVSSNWLAGEYPPARSFAGRIGGLVAINLGREESERIHPRRSFAVWQEKVGERCSPWRTSELEAGAALREALLEVYAPDGRPRNAEP
jgi:light-regulated signal transduction histidine kinase (bacteriophytochrome)